jgi:hypothetical protein
MMARPLAISPLQTQGDSFRVLAQNYFLGVGIAWLLCSCNNPRWFSEWQYIPFPVINLVLH